MYLFSVCVMVPRSLSFFFYFLARSYLTRARKEIIQSKKKNVKGRKRKRFTSAGMDAGSLGTVGSCGPFSVCERRRSAVKCTSAVISRVQ